jgi:hypothetical protein
MTVLLCFTTAVIRKDAIAAHYPGGLHAFAKEYAPLREDDELAAICCMSTGELGEIVAHIAATGFDVARHVAIGDRWAGPFEVVPGIVFENLGGSGGMPQWAARAAG